MEVPQKFHPPKSFSFPKRAFRGRLRSFRSEWCEEFDWLHYDGTGDRAFCHLCISAEAENLFLASTKREPCFITTGFTYWRDAKAAFSKHAKSVCHKEAIQAITKRTETPDVAELLSSQHAAEKAMNRDMLRRIIQNLRFLSRQGLALRGHSDGADSNFTQLLHLRAFDCPGVTAWVEKKSNKYISGDIQNELLQIMAHNILRTISSCIRRNGFYSLMADECTDVANKEQFVVCIRWVDHDLVGNEEVIGLYQVDNISSNTLTLTLEDVLLRLGLAIQNCRGQCYDGASNMTGSRNGVATQIQAKEPKAVLTHCYGHALNLAVSDSIKKTKVCRDAMDVAFEIAKLIRFSPKRNAMFDKIRAEDTLEDNTVSKGIRALCPTRWTVRGDALESILEHWATLNELWDECLDTQLDPDVKARIIGAKAQMSKFALLFGIHLCKKLLKITDNLSRTLQKQSLSAAEGQNIAAKTVITLEKMRSSEAFDQFFQVVNLSRSELEVDPPQLPRKRKAPSRFEIGSGSPSFSNTVEDHYRAIFFEGLDLVINSVKHRFEQPGYKIYRNLEELLVLAANGKDYRDQLKAVNETYQGDFDSSLLCTQLECLSTWFSGRGDLSLFECLEALSAMSAAEKSYFSEVCVIVKLITVMPATNAVSERSFSAMRRLKTYLRSTMRQSRLNYLMLLAINKDRLDKIDVDDIGEEFVTGSEHRLTQFGRFQLEK